MMAMCSGHPRVGGEQDNVSKTDAHDSGSSPRGRGTVAPPEIAADANRVIPAWAGNSRTISVSSARSSGHPRVGGEQFLHTLAVNGITGSSPRGRGTG